MSLLRAYRRRGVRGANKARMGVAYIMINDYRNEPCFSMHSFLMNVYVNTGYGDSLSVPRYEISVSWYSCVGQVLKAYGTKVLTTAVR